MPPTRFVRGYRAFPLTILLVAGVSHASAIESVAPGESIQDAVDRVDNPGIVLVEPGEYTECLSVPLGRQITVAALEGSAETTLSCGFGDRAVQVDGTLDLRGFTITHTGFGGGGIRVEGTFTGQDLALVDMLESTAAGAGLTVLDGVATLLDVRFDQLATSSNGGAIAVNDDGILTLLGATITGTTAAGDGGAIYVRDGFLDAVDLVVDGSFRPISARNGGGLYVATTGDVSLTAASFEATTASFDGGGVYIEERARAVVGSSLEVIGADAARDGGGIYVLGPLDMLGGRVSDNHAGEGGGGLFVDGGSVSLRATAVTGNSADGKPELEGWPSGAGLYVDNADVETGDCTITDNVATSPDALGGGLYVVDRSTWTSRGDVLADNAARDGAGAWIRSVEAVDILQSAVTGNLASGIGGAMYIDDAITLTNTTIDRNEAVTSGGGLFVDNDADVGLVGTDLTNNVAALGDGGGAFVGDGATLDLVGCRVQGNETLAGVGGGLRYLGTDADGGLTLSTTHVSENIAPTGAGIAAERGELTVDASWIYDNASTGDGGGLQIIASHGALVSRSVLCGNDAERGAGIYLERSFGERRIVNTALQGNAATVAGGAVYDGGWADGADTPITAFEYITAVANRGPDTLAGIVADTFVANDSVLDLTDSVLDANGTHHIAGLGARVARVDGRGVVFFDSLGSTFNTDDALVGADENIVADPDIRDDGGPSPDCLTHDLRAFASASEGGALRGFHSRGVGAGVDFAPGALGSIFLADVPFSDGVQLAQGDCDPDDPTISPDIPEDPTNEFDDDCVLGADVDGDGDGFLAEAIGGADCIELNPLANPDAVEIWGDGVDLNCDDRVDDDQDGDGFDDGADCDNSDFRVGPHAIDVPYDGVDQDCDGANDFDADGDSASAVEHGGADCDDLNVLIGPIQDEIWYDGIDQNCDDADDFDQDGDGYRSSDFGGDDCDDLDPAINPGATEVYAEDAGLNKAYNGIDEDCDGEDLVDVDGDGAIAEEAGGDDCDDRRDDVYPGAPELLDGDDNDCDGVGDPDTDGDGILDFWENEFGSDPTEVDSDNDLIDDRTEWGDDDRNPIDTDGDGTYDVIDDDSDADTLADVLEGQIDTDGDGLPNYRDPDDDGDGLDTELEFAGGIDSDGDGTPDYLDRDSDNDGVIDGIDPNPTDRGGDGLDSDDAPVVGKYGFGCSTQGGAAGGWLALAMVAVFSRRR